METGIINQFEEIYEVESDSIFRFCLVRVSNREQALDITQETFLRLWQTLQQNKEVQNSRAFLFTVAHRLIIDWYRKKKSFSLDKMMSGTTDGESAYDPVDEKTIEGIEEGTEGRFLLDKLNELDPTHRHPVYLRFVEGLSPPEIGKILGVSANTASVRVNRGLAELRKKTGYDKDGKSSNK